MKSQTFNKDILNNKPLLDAICELSYSGILIIEDDYKILYVNQKIEDIFGYAREELLGEDLRLFINSESKELPNRQYGKQKNENQPPRYEIEMTTKDNKKRNIEFSYTKVKHHGGKQLIVCHLLDLTERRRVESELRKSEKNLAYLFHNVSDFVMTHDADGKIIALNHNYLNDVGYSKKELATMKMKDFLAPTYRRHFDAYLARILDKGFDQGIMRIRNKQGNEFLIEYKNHLIHDSEGNVLIHGIGRDITETYRAQKALKESEKKLRIAKDGLEARVRSRTKELESVNQQLKSQKLELEETNTALRVLLKKKGEGQNELEERMLLNAKELMLPLLSKLKLGGLTVKQKTYLDSVELALNEIISPFAKNVMSKYYDLTPAEIQIANFIKEGKTNKEIAKILNTAPSTVHFHRDNIRKKLKIKNRKINLRTYLRSLDH